MDVCIFSDCKGDMRSVSLVFSPPTESWKFSLSSVNRNYGNVFSASLVNGKVRGCLRLQ